MRDPLPQKYQLRLGSQQLYIDGVIGEGASSIVYVAHGYDNLDNPVQWFVKECYPIGETICRESKNQSLKWDNDAAKSASFERFTNAYLRLRNMKNDSVIGNSIILATDIYDANGTKYTITETKHAKTLNQVSFNSVSEMLVVTLELTNIVKKIHAAGWLHLDLKPENILVDPSSPNNMWMFDVDSFASIHAIEDRRIRMLSFSKEWAAPEQVQGCLDKICLATDLYAIGAILFDMIFGRKPDSIDRGFYAVWEFGGALFENTNPKVKRQLTEIFHNTLASSPKRRYQNADELEMALRDALKTATDLQYLITNCPPPTRTFIGRDTELSAIHAAFERGERIVALRGIGGIGKSELSKRFAQIYSSKFDSILFCRSHAGDTVIQLLDRITITGGGNNNQDKEELLNRLLTKDILLIIDGADEEYSDSNRLLELNCKILITGRIDWQSIISITAIPVAELSPQEQYALFEVEYGATIGEADRRNVSRILRDINGFTLLIPLIAKQLKLGTDTISETQRKIHKAGVKATSQVKVRHYKDTAMHDSTFNILRTVFTMANLSEDEQYVMRCLALLNGFSFDYRDILEWIGQSNADTLNDLIYKSFVQRHGVGTDSVIEMHNVVAEVALVELEPMVTNCVGIRDRIWSFAFNWGECNKNPLSQYWGGYAPTYITDADKYRYDNYCSLFDSIFSKCNLNNLNEKVFWVRVMEKLSCVLYGYMDEYEDFLLSVLSDNSIKGNSSLSYVKPMIAIALETECLPKCDLYGQNGDLREALHYAKIANELSENHPERDKLKFKIAFAFYQYLCASSMNYDSYWETDGFEGMVDFVGEILKYLCEEGNIEQVAGEPAHNRISVLSENNQKSETLSIALKNIYDDFLYKTSDKGIETEINIRNPNFDYKPDIEQLTQTMNDDFDIVDDTSRHDDTVGSEVDSTILAFLQDKENQLNELFRLGIQRPMGLVCFWSMWCLWEKPEWSDEIKSEIHRMMPEIDELPAYDITIISQRPICIQYAKLEAAFICMYALLNEEEKCKEHMQKLLPCYEKLIFDHENYVLGTHLAWSVIASGMPGAASMVNAKVDIIPNHLALDFFDKLVVIMEEYNSKLGHSNGDLLEVYQHILSQAEANENYEFILKYSKRIADATAIHFQRK